MPTYIRFDDNGVQIETLVKKNQPTGDGWLKAPNDFESSKRYRRDADDTIREETEVENEELFLSLARGKAYDEVKYITDQHRLKYSGYSAGKNKAYETQARSALRVLEADAAGDPVDPLDDQILGALASERSITVPEMAALIKTKVDERDIALALIEAKEDKANKIIEAATNREDLRTDLESLKAELETALAAL